MAKAGDSFYNTVGELTKELPSIGSARATAHAIDRWAEATESFTSAFETLLRQNQNYPKQGPSRGGQEVRAVSAKIKSIQRDYPTFVPGMQSLTKRFQTDSDVQKSVRRLRASLNRLKELLDSASAMMTRGD